MNNIDTNTLLLVLAVIFLVLAGYFNFRPKKKTNQPSGTDNSTTPLRLQAYGGDHRKHRRNCGHRQDYPPAV